MNSIVRTSVISAEPISLASMKNWLRVPTSVTNDDVDEDEELDDEPVFEHVVYAMLGGCEGKSRLRSDQLREADLS